MLTGCSLTSKPARSLHSRLVSELSTLSKGATGERVRRLSKQPYCYRIHAMTENRDDRTEKKEPNRQSSRCKKGINEREKERDR